jgi:hypothetical protein
MSAGVIGEESVYATAGKPLPQDIQDCAQWLLNEPLSVAYQSEWAGLDQHVGLLGRAWDGRRCVVVVVVVCGGV